MTNILYTLTYLRDGATDTTEHKMTEQWTDKNPLPTTEQLQAQTFYSYYVPEKVKLCQAEVVVLNSEDYPGFYYRHRSAKCSRLY